MSMGKRIKLARTARMTQAKLGELLPTAPTGLPRPAEAVSKGAVSQWEQDKVTPTLEALAAASLLLGRSLDHLVFGRSMTFEARIDALPSGFRAEVLKSVLSVIESAEEAATALAKVARPAKTVK
jgi:transcriptional regulator with XRE-family HTH domain